MIGTCETTMKFTFRFLLDQNDIKRLLYPSND